VGDYTTYQKSLLTNCPTDGSHEALCELGIFKHSITKGLAIIAVIVVTDQHLDFSLPLPSSSHTIGHKVLVILPFKW
jgi:hypothetical protein